MEYNQFHKLLHLQGIRDKENIPLLENFLKKFPYCQSAHLLLAKALHEQNNIHYGEQLKMAAAFAPDREALKNLIDQKAEDVEFEFPPRKKEISQHQVQENFTEVKTGTAGPFEEWYSQDEISGRAFLEQREKEKLLDPHEVIRKRLNEILGTTPPPMSPPQAAEAGLKSESGRSDKEIPEIKIEERGITRPVFTRPDTEEEIYREDQLAENKIEEEQLHPEPEKTEEEKSILEQAAKARDVLDKLELEHAMEESILDSLEKMPVLEPSKKDAPAPAADLSQDKPAEKAPAGSPTSPRSFLDWLKVVPGSGRSGFEEVKAPVITEPVVSLPLPETDEDLADAEKQLSDDELIEKFLLSDPKIVPSRAEFYSPLAQAKKSVMDHDDVVSETLAQIYLRQGNARKARWCYEKLMLLHPEKSAFFAALLKEIEDQTNSKEDL